MRALRTLETPKPSALELVKPENHPIESLARQILEDYPKLQKELELTQERASLLETIRHSMREEIDLLGMRYQDLLAELDKLNGKYETMNKELVDQVTKKDEELKELRSITDSEMKRLKAENIMIKKYYRYSAPPERQRVL